MSTTDADRPATAVAVGNHPPLVGKMMAVAHRLHAINVLQTDLDRAFGAYEKDRDQLSEEERVTIESKFAPWMQAAWDQWRKDRASQRTGDRLGEISRAIDLDDRS